MGSVSKGRGYDVTQLVSSSEELSCSFTFFGVYDLLFYYSFSLELLDFLEEDDDLEDEDEFELELEARSGFHD